MNVLQLKRILCHFPGERGKERWWRGRWRCGRRCCEIGCVVLMEQSSPQPGKLSSHSAMRVCVGWGCTENVRKKACKCPSASEHTTHTHYPHVSDPYICIRFTSHTQSFRNLHTCAGKTSFTGTVSVITSHTQGSSLLFSSRPDQIKWSKEGIDTHTPSLSLIHKYSKTHTFHSCVCLSAIE